MQQWDPNAGYYSLSLFRRYRLSTLFTGAETSDALRRFFSISSG
jgi:hypothetical protein